MIAPKKTEDEEAPFDLVAAVDAFFRPGGLLEQGFRGSDFAYEARPQQRAMARAVAQALADRRHLAVEAGTGVGKSLAYLVPLILAAKAAKTQAMVSTYTISLQEQLMHKDLPFLEEHLGVPFKAVLVKGRSNYLCLRRLARAERNAPELFKSRENEELAYLREWAGRTEEGSLQELRQQPSPDLWSAVNVEHGNCMWQRCPEFARCFVMKARAAIKEADLLVVNHHLFFSDLGLRQQGGAILPEAGLAVLDEAHMLESVASEHLGLRLSQYQLEHWLRRLYTPETSKGLLAVLRKGEAAHLVTQLWDATERLFKDIRDWAQFTADKGQQVVADPIPVETRIPALISALAGELRELHDATEDLDLRAEVQSVRRRGLELRDALESFLAKSVPDCVYWVEREGPRGTRTALNAAPIEVAPLLKDQLFGQLDAVVMTSATLAVEDRLDYFLQRMGAEGAEALGVGSPFDYARQMKLIVPKGMPDPNQFEPYAAATALAVERYTRRTKGRAFVLFTSAKFLREVAGRVRPSLAADGYELIVQGEDLSRHAMLDRFKQTKKAILFGLASFWMGVDVRGEALSNVIIPRLPFAVPDEPVTKARMDRIEERGGDAFKEYSLPEAILKFRQGVGRLIRSSTDEGIVVILDPRFSTKWYGKRFLRSLPECPVEVEDL